MRYKTMNLQDAQRFLELKKTVDDLIIQVNNLTEFIQSITSKSEDKDVKDIKQKND